MLNDMGNAVTTKGIPPAVSFTVVALSSYLKTLPAISLASNVCLLPVLSVSLVGSAAVVGF